MSDDLSKTTDGKFPSLYIRDPEEIEAMRYLISKGATFLDANGYPLGEETALQKLSMQNPNMAFGVKRQSADPRDRQVSFYIPPVAPTVTQASLMEFESKIENQGKLGSCFAQAGVGALELMEVKERRQFVDLSRMFNFWTTHKIEDSLGEDDGATLRNAVKSLAKYGTCIESLCPYDIADAWNQPSKQAFSTAYTRRIREYQAVKVDVMQVRGLLAMGFPIIFGLDLFEEFMSVKVSLSGMVPDPTPSSKPVGGHAMLITAFDDKKVSLANEEGMFGLRNSWGESWGDRGHAWISYRYFATHAFDPWVITRDDT